MAALDHARHLLAGGTPFDSGGWVVFPIDRPRYGSGREEFVMEPVTGKAIPVLTGEVLRIRQIEGGQCVDFNGYALHDYKEYLDCGFNRGRDVPTGKGTLIFSGSPRWRPMYAILDCQETFDQYYSGHRCNDMQYEREYGFVGHPNCQDTLAEAIREYRLTPDDVHDSYNLWMKVITDADGKKRFLWNRARAGDYVDMLALFDTLSVAAICGGDISSVNNFGPTPVRVQVFEPSPETMQTVQVLQQRFGSYRCQKTPKDFRVQNILATRELTPDPNYRPDYLPMGLKVAVEVETSGELDAVLDALMKTGVYGASRDKALIACFAKWFDLNRARERGIRLSIKD
jgi:uncharacterized protein YcgI (DUF1989 family)